MILRFLVPIFVAVGVLVAVYLILVALQPSECRIERTAEIGALAGLIFPRINDIRQFNEWNPFAKTDPPGELTYHGS